MGLYTYDILEPGKSGDASLETLTREFAPLHMQAWQKNKRGLYKKEYELNVQSFAAMWLNKALKIFMAYRETKPVGYATGILFRPLEYNASVFQVDDWYTDNNREVEEGLFDYIVNALRFVGCDEIWMAQHEGGSLPNLGPGWKQQAVVRQVRYTKE